MSEENQTNGPSSNEEDRITVKKSAYNNMLKGIVAAIAIAAFLGGFAICSMGDNSDSLSADEIKEMIIKVKGSTMPQPTQMPNQPSTPQILQISLDDDPVKGDPDAPVTIVEFSDFQCPFCARFSTQTLPVLQEKYIDTGKVKLVYRDFPIDGLHANARPVHIASECADEQGKFWEYHDVLFENQRQWNKLSTSDLRAQLNQYATSMGLDTVSFDSCLLSQSIADEVNADYLQATQYGSTGTPTFFIGNEKNGFVKLVGAQPFAAFQKVIDAHLG